MTPDELRKGAEVWSHEHLVEKALAAADAWEAEEKLVGEYQRAYLKEFDVVEAWERAYNMLSGHVECAKVLRWCADCDRAHRAALAGEEK